MRSCGAGVSTAATSHAGTMARRHLSSDRRGQGWPLKRRIIRSVQEATHADSLRSTPALRARGVCGCRDAADICRASCRERGQARALPALSRRQGGVHLSGGYLDRGRERPERPPHHRQPGARCLSAFLAGWPMDCVLQRSRRQPGRLYRAGRGRHTEAADASLGRRYRARLGA